MDGVEKREAAKPSARAQGNRDGKGGENQKLELEARTANVLWHQRGSMAKQTCR